MDFIQSVPPVTRVYLAAVVGTTLLCAAGFAGPLSFYRNDYLIWSEHQYWRLLTCFTFVSSEVNLHVLLTLNYIYFFCRALESGHYHGNTAGFIMLFVYGCTAIHLIASYFKFVLLSHALTMMLVYVWSRRSPDEHLQLWGVLPLAAPWFPWVVLAMDALLGASVQVDLIGLAVGHIYWYLVDVFPNDPVGFHVLRTPAFLSVPSPRPALAPPACSPCSHTPPLPRSAPTRTPRAPSPSPSSHATPVPSRPSVSHSPTTLYLLHPSQYLLGEGAADVDANALASEYVDAGDDSSSESSGSDADDAAATPHPEPLDQGAPPGAAAAGAAGAAGDDNVDIVSDGDGDAHPTLRRRRAGGAGADL